MRMFSEKLIIGYRIVTYIFVELFITHVVHYVLHYIDFLRLVFLGCGGEEGYCVLQFTLNIFDTLICLVCFTRC